MLKFNHTSNIHIVFLFLRKFFYSICLLYQFSLREAHDYLKKKMAICISASRRNHFYTFALRVHLTFNSTLCTMKASYQRTYLPLFFFTFLYGIAFNNNSSKMLLALLLQIQIVLCMFAQENICIMDNINDDF